VLKVRKLTDEMNDVARNRIETQLAEVELLMSMYTNKGELEFDDESQLADLRAALSSESATSLVGGGLGFTLHLTAMQVRFFISDWTHDNYTFRPAIWTISAKIDIFRSGKKWYILCCDMIYAASDVLFGRFEPTNSFYL